MTRARSPILATTTAAAVALTFGACTAFAQQSPYGQRQGQQGQQAQQQGQQNEVAGQAQIREKDGPTFDVQGDQPARLIVLFPQQDQQSQSRRGSASQSGADLQGLELVLVEMEIPQQQQAEGGEGDQAQLAGQRRGRRGANRGEGIPTGREIVFSPDQAVQGLATHQLESNGQQRQYMVVARGGGQEFEINEVGRGGEGIVLLRIQAQPTQEQQQQYEEQMTQYRERQQQRQQQNQQQNQQGQQGDQEGQQGGQEGGQQGQQGQQQGAQGQQQGGQGQQGDEPQRPQPSDAAIIMVYTGQSQQQR